MGIIYIGWEDFPATIFQFFTGQFFFSAVFAFYSIPVMIPCGKYTWVGIGSEKTEMVHKPMSEPNSCWFMVRKWLSAILV
jgi:hypothetical protein